MKAQVASGRDLGGQLISRREGTRMAFLIPDCPPPELVADAAQLAADETEHWAAAKRGSRKEPASDHQPSQVSHPSSPSPLSVTRSNRALVAIWGRP
jgi:hypothetical protein